MTAEEQAKVDKADALLREVESSLMRRRAVNPTDRTVDRIHINLGVLSAARAALEKCG